MFVGDSLSLNQFNSLACMIHAAVPNSRTTFRQRDALQSLTFEVGSFLSFLCLFFSLHCFETIKGSKIVKGIFFNDINLI
jgi:hypothetical protein